MASTNQKDRTTPRAADKSLREQSRERVRAGVAAGLVVLAPSGLATARSRIAPRFEDVPDDFVDRVAEHQRRLDAHQQELIATDRLGEAVAEAREVEDLNWLLRCGDIQGEALRALDVDLVEAPLLVAYAAMKFSPMLSLLAYDARAPQDLLAAAKPLVDAMIGKVEPIDGWRYALVLIFRLHFGDLVVRSRPRASAKQILERLRAMAGDLPASLDRPSRAQLDRAADVLRKLRIAERSGGRSGAVTPWGATRLFAGAFGITLPKSESEARRWTKKRLTA